jgi:hypothetical protein
MAYKIHPQKSEIALPPVKRPIGNGGHGLKDQLPFPLGKEWISLKDQRGWGY